MDSQPFSSLLKDNVTRREMVDSLETVAFLFVCILKIV